MWALGSCGSELRKLRYGHWLVDCRAIDNGNGCLQAPAPARPFTNVSRSSTRKRARRSTCTC